MPIDQMLVTSRGLMDEAVACAGVAECASITSGDGGSGPVFRLGLGLILTTGNALRVVATVATTLPIDGKGVIRAIDLAVFPISVTA